MPITASPRLGLTRWSDDADIVTREQFDADHGALDDLTAIDGQGTLAARPAAGVRGRYYYATDNGFLYRDTGTAWATINAQVTVGGSTPPAIADAGAEGGSNAAARADHTHALHPQTARRDTAQTFTAQQTLERASAADAALRALVAGDTHARLVALAGGTLVWSSGAAVPDVNLYRNAADDLRTDDRLEAADGFVEDLFDSTPGGNFAVDLRNGTTQRFTLTANRTITGLTNPPANGKVIALTLIIKQDATGGRTLTWPASVKWPGGTAPTLTATGGRSDVISLVSHDGGTAWLGFVGGLNFNY